ncbi:MAG: sulfatase-like hydrolase/transferase, partial [Verrucomicrobiota bacterium]
PNVDALAERGVRFTNAYTTAGVCAPCRSGIITGMYQNSIGSHHMRCNAKLPDWLKPFPMYLREAGYFCTNHSKTDYQFSSPSKNEIWDACGGKSADWSKRAEGQPFFAVYNFTGCHESGIAGESKYKSVTAPLSDDQRQDPDKLTTLPPYYPDTPVTREDWKRNYELITALDIWVGEHLQRLEEAGELENTIVFFWSDHGVGLPRAKRWLYDSGTHIPFIVSVPKKFQDSVNLDMQTADDRLVNSVDFGPTVLEIAGVERPDHLQGRSILGKPRDYVYGARDRMDERYDIIRAVRDKRFRYIRNFEPLKPYYQYMNTPEKGATMCEIRAAEKAGNVSGAAKLFSAKSKPTEELYDLKNDPHEINNLANDPEFTEKLDELRSALTDWQNEVGDIGLVPESEITRLEEAAGSTYAVLRQKEDPVAYIAELTAVATAASDKTGIPQLATALTHEDASIRYWGATGLGNFSGQVREDKKITKSLKGLLTDESLGVQVAAARALARMGELKQSLPVLESVLAGPNEWARLEAAIVLDYLDEAASASLPAMKAALKDQPNKYIIRVANRAVNDLEGTNNVVP